MCRPPMKICGTVLRPPLRWRISWRAPSTCSTSISVNSTPFSCSRRRARAHQGHHEVAYITTWGLSAITSAALPGQRQSLGAPVLHAAAQVEDLGEAGGVQGAGQRRGARAVLADQQQQPVLEALQLLGGIGVLLGGEVPGAVDVAGGEGLAGAQVVHRRAL